VEAQLEEQWFDKPGVLFPWLIEVQGLPAGFALIGNRQLATAMGMDAEFYLHEFHVAAGYRRQGIGRAAIEQLGRIHPGVWALVVLSENQAALRFWNATLPAANCEFQLSDEGVRFVRFRIGHGSVPRERRATRPKDGPS
jgi:predicted acetyltransferase